MIKDLIKNNPTKITLKSVTYKDNGFGTQVVDTSAPSNSKTITCRISYTGYNECVSSSANAYSTDYSQYIITEKKDKIYKGQTFDNYEIGVVFPIKFFGKIVGYQAKLKESYNG